MDAKKLIIIPDVHGRSFWRKAVEDFPEEEFIFLGDYLDPYPREGISSEQAFEGLEEIVALKERRPDKVTLLWGNHDLHYLYSILEGSRWDRSNAGKNWSFFKEHETCFKIAAERTVCGKRYLFTHAGVGKQWVKYLDSSLNEEQVTAAWLNSCFPSHPFIQHLSCVSMLRGGFSQFGSCIWADAREHFDEENNFACIIQIFGHTMMSEPINYDNRIFCLDCQECFYLDLENGGIFFLYNQNPIRQF